tara:strand:- start:42 stop:656 length:615 start_codon:yes stop_codon:yes gene_type:complete
MEPSSLSPKIYKEYPDNYFMGCYKLDDDLVDDILKWKHEQKHLGEEQILHDKKSNDLSKKCIQWRIYNNFYYHPWHNYKTALKVCFEKYFKKFESARLMHGSLELEHYNLQHYRPSDGFYTWHKENNGEPNVLHRHLVFMTYLTTTPNAGTEFLTQNLTVPCEKGVTLIWPATWTHTHRGQISSTHEKTIVTGWLRLKDMEDNK